MGTQQLLTIGGIMLFTFLTLSFSSSSLNQSSATNFNEAVLTATGLGQGLLDEIHTKAFDENTILAAVDTVTDLTDPYLLAYESGEGKVVVGQAKKHGYDASITFDDVDDYNGFSRDYTDKLLDEFNVKVDVYYIKISNPDSKSSTRTFTKRVDITITNPYLTIDESDSTGILKLTSIITY